MASVVGAVREPPSRDVTKAIALLSALVETNAALSSVEALLEGGSRTAPTPNRRPCMRFGVRALRRLPKLVLQRRDLGECGLIGPVNLEVQPVESVVAGMVLGAGLWAGLDRHQAGDVFQVMDDAGADQRQAGRAKRRGLRRVGQYHGPPQDVAQHLEPELGAGKTTGGPERGRGPRHVVERVDDAAHAKADS